MAIAFVQTNASGTSASANPTTASSTTSTGSLIVATIVNDSGSPSYQTSLTDNKVGNSYTRIATASNGGSDHELWYGVLVQGGAGHTFTFGFSLAGASNISWVIQEFSGSWGATPLDQRAPALLTLSTGSSTAVLSATTSTTTNADEVLVGSLSHIGATTTATAGGSFSNLVKAGVTGVSPAGCWAIQESQVVAATGTYSASATLGASRGWGAKIATFLESGVSSTPSPEPIQGLPSTNIHRSFSW